MAEQTPGNLLGLGAGFMLGRSATNNPRMDQAVDRLEDQVTKVADALQLLTGHVQGAAKGTGAPGATTQAAGRAVGGDVSWGGSHAPSSHRADTPTRVGGGSGGGSHRGNGGDVSFGGDDGSGGPAHRKNWGDRAQDHYDARGGAFGIAKSAAKGTAVAGGAGLVTYTMNHADSQTTNQAVAAQFSYGRDYMPAYRAMFGNNYTAANAADASALGQAMGARSGFTAGSNKYGGTNQFNMSMARVQSISLADPSITNVQSFAAANALGSVGSFNKLAGLGITPTSAHGGLGDPMSIARQILAKMPGSKNVKTAEQLDAAFGPSGSVTVTIQGMVSNGYIPAESEGAVTSAMRTILRAQIGGMSYSSLTSNLQQASMSPQSQAGKSARSALQGIGVNNSAISAIRQNEGMSRASEAETVEGFTTGLKQSTEVLTQFREVLNSILAIPGVGEASGYGSGVTAQLGRFINKIPGGSMVTGFFGGDGPASMSSGAMMYGAASGAAAAGASMGGGVNTGIVSRGSSGGTGSSGSAARTSSYSLGGVKPWVSKAASILGPRFGIKSIGGVGSRSRTSDHPKGLALDFMCSTAQGNQLAPYVVANHKALNVTYVIWRQRIWSINNPSWKQMEDRGNPTENHMDHVHVSFLASPTNSDMGDLPAGNLGTGTKVPGAASSPDNGAAAVFAAAVGTPSGGSGSGFGAYSEAAALGLGGSGGGVSAMFAASTGSGTPGSGSTGGRTSGTAAGPGSAMSGSVRTTSANIDWTRGKDREQLAHLAANSDILLLQEANDVNLDKLLPKGWKSNQNMRNSGTMGSAIAWNAAKLGNNIGKSGLAFGTLQDGGRSNTRYLSYLDANLNGQKTRLISGHFPLDKHGSKKQFEENLREVINSRPKGAEWLLGTDANQRLSELAKRLGGRAAGGGIVGQISSPGLRTGGISVDKFGEGIGATDHAAISQSITTRQSPARGNGGSPAQNIALGRALASQRGWTGEQWQDLKTLWQHESGWRTDADNPTSSAYGIPQALTELHGLGSKYKKDPRTQINWGLNYIQGRYGNPSKAWDFWQKNNWYDSGEWNIRDDKDARVHKGEMIFPAKIADIVRSELTSPGIRGNRGGGASITFQTGAIVVKMGGGSVSRREAEIAGTQIVDAVMEDRRMKQLAEGL